MVSGDAALELRSGSAVHRAVKAGAQDDLQKGRRYRVECTRGSRARAPAGRAGPRRGSEALAAMVSGEEFDRIYKEWERGERQLRADVGIHHDDIHAPRRRAHPASAPGLGREG